MLSPTVATAKSMLKLSETNCDSKGHNVTLTLKDRRPLLPGQDVALIAVLGFAGTSGKHRPLRSTLSVFSWSVE